ncbi:hypothetical protein Kpho02_28950 [Kitasatospora phosalacinea]|uniref:Uncharacterized protein n=1 Tax=Kitasatospora phosalacinea TaxID=2065 RepID=A0A9W6Q8V5_9ACTN|nr:hypothetical protein Kpho02_28950 [Kitasatospora phosalacinea]
MLRPVAVLWSLLLAALLALLPCAASARTLSAPAPGQEPPGTSASASVPASSSAPASAPAPSSTPASAAKPATGASTSRSAARVAVGHAAVSHHPSAAVDGSGPEFILCTAEGPGPVPGHGCSSHPFCGPESHLPNAPPQPGTAVRPQLVAPPVVPAASAPGAPTGSHHAPDLHVLQVHRS